METRTFFFNENEKKDKIYKLIGVKNQNVERYVDIIAKKAHNNKIGYFQFFEKDAKIYYKIYIMPKIYKVEERECNDCEEYKREFINFFKHYYRLLSKGYDINKFSLGGNISDLSYRSTDRVKELASDNIKDIDDFVVHNYKDALSVIESFFTKHKKQIEMQEKFQLQSIRSKLDIKRNIVEPNKSNIHQTRKKSILFSNIALITMEVLKYFLNHKIKNFNTTIKRDELKKDTNKIYKSIKLKFSKNYDFSFKIREILLPRISQEFAKNDENKNLYKALLKLVGKEHYYNHNTKKEIFKEENMVSIFFEPDMLYEWIVYDKLIESREFDEVLKDGKDNIKLPFELIPSNKKTYSSKPDLVIVKDNKKYPVDAKWKILNTKSPSFDNDIAKLRRDAKIRGVNKGYLVYPKFDENSNFKPDIEYKYDFDDFVFELKIIHVVS